MRIFPPPDHAHTRLLCASLPTSTSDPDGYSDGAPQLAPLSSERATAASPQRSRPCPLASNPTSIGLVVAPGTVTGAPHWPYAGAARKPRIAQERPAVARRIPRPYGERRLTY